MNEFHVYLTDRSFSKVYADAFEACNHFLRFIALTSQDGVTRHTVRRFPRERVTGIYRQL